jgi:surface protein
MNPDIIYEILKFLHLCPEENGGALLAKKVHISLNCTSIINTDRLEKPIVLCANENTVILKKISEKSTIKYENSGGNAIYKYVDNYGQIYYLKDNNWTVKMFDYNGLLFMNKSILDVHSIGNRTNLVGIFYECRELDSCMGKKWDTSNVTDMSCMFSYCNNLNKTIGKNWNTSKVSDMTCMFANCSKLNKNVGKNWNTSSVECMSGMFNFCDVLNKNIGKYWDTSKVCEMSNMFYDCKRLNQPIGENWDISKVIEANNMFYGCESLTFEIVEKWKKSGADISNMFEGCPIFRKF